MCKDWERIETNIIWESSDYDGEATLKQKLEQNYQNNEETERQDRETLWDLMLEKDRVYKGHIQGFIYKAALEEGASMPQAVIAKGPLPGAQDLAQAWCLQEGSLVRQRYIVAEGQKEVSVDLRLHSGKDPSNIRLRINS